MDRDLFTNKWILCGIGILILFSIACVWWYYYDTAPDRKAAADAEKLLRQNIADQTLTKQGQNRLSTTSKIPLDTGGINEATDDLTEIPTTASNELTISDTGEKRVGDTNKEVRVSPYGFGPYPDVPQGFIDAIGHPFWLLPDEILRRRRKPPSRDVELMQRVMVKLWKQGRTDVEATFMDGDKVIVHFKNRIYVRYSTVTNPKGEEIRYFSSWRSGSVQPPEYKPGQPNLITEKDVPFGVEIIDMDKEDPGIDPYEFLGLN